jgi:Excreted virulence factor EspC, type VII ESX diderm
MGDIDAARVDAAVLLGVAGQYQAVADDLDAAVRVHSAGLAFDGASAGRSYTGHGDAVRMSLDDIVLRLREWSRASAEIAAALRASAHRYVEADAHAASRVG